MGMFDSLMDPGQIGQNALLGFQQGRQMRQENDTRNALSVLAQNPNDPNAYEMLAKANPELAIQYRGQMGQQQAAQQKQQQTQMVQLGRLLDYAKDEQTYQQARQAAQQIGIDISRAPANFDPAWVQQQKLAVSAFQDPKAMEALSSAGKQAVDEGFRPGTPDFNDRVREIWSIGERKLIPTQPGGGVARYDPVTGRTEMVIVPNTGGYAAGAAAGGGGIQEGATATNPQTGEKIQFRGGQWVPMGGGSGGNVGGGFRP